MTASPPPSSDPWAAFRPGAVLLLLVLILVAYGGSLHNGFVFDDAIFMERDSRVHSWAGQRHFFSEPLWAGVNDQNTGKTLHQYYRPLQPLPLVISNVYFDGQAWPSHAMNLILHFFNTLLVYGILRLLSGSRRPALILAALFAVHPACSESVLWISDFAGLGVAFCTLAILRIHMRSGPAPFAAESCALLYLTAMFFKESGMLIPLLLLAYDATARRHVSGADSAQTTIKDYTLMFGPLGMYLVLRINALGSFLPGATVLEFTTSDLLINAVALIPQYVHSFFWAFDPNMYHDFDVATGFEDPRFIMGAAFVVAGWVTMMATRHKRPIVAFGLLWAAFSVAPFLIVRWPQLNVFAERYLYLPSVGLLAAVAGLVGVTHVENWSRLRGYAFGTAASALIVLFTMIGQDRTIDWRNEESIYQKTLTQSDRAGLIRNNLSLVYLKDGRPSDGIAVQEKLVKSDPDFPGAWHNLGLLYLAAARNQEALDAFKAANERDPGNPSTLLNLGYSQDLNGQRAAAVATYFRLVENHPEHVEAHFNLALIAYEAGQFANAQAAV